MWGLIQAAISAGLSIFGNTVGSQKVTKVRYAPCTKADLKSPESTKFELPESNVCPELSREYTLTYFSPVSNPYNDPSKYYQRIPSGTPNEPMLILGPSSWDTLMPNIRMTKIAIGAENDVVKGLFVDSLPLNMCPQKVSNKLESGSVVESAQAVPLPFESDAKGNITNQADKRLWVFPGRPFKSDVNVPVRADTKNGVTTYAANNGLATILYIYAVRDSTLFIELGGANGGSVPVYANGFDPVTKVGLPLNPSYTGGTRGVVYGLYDLKAGDVLKVWLGSVGQELASPTDVPQFDGNGQGGLATLLGGANGGGASYITHFLNADGRSLERAFANETLYSKLVCVAGSGGGASRNASGGSAGLTDLAFLYGQRSGKNTYGSAGGQSFVLGTAPYVPGLRVNGYSGGGGVETAGGNSNVFEPLEPMSSYGRRLDPFKEGSGGGSVVTDTGSGGGGGGGGLFGGGAGGFNGRAKPNNIHGAGGGGSSWTGLLKTATSGEPVTLNAYRDANWSTIPTSKDFPLSYSGYSDFGYLVIGLTK